MLEAHFVSVTADRIHAEAKYARVTCTSRFKPTDADTFLSTLEMKLAIRSAARGARTVREEFLEEGMYLQFFILFINGSSYGR